jgi:hypothetical protein
MCEQDTLNIATQEQMMDITIRARGLELDNETREMILRRTGFALDAFGDRVESAAIYLMDLNGPRGGVDKLCQVNIRVAGLSQLAVVEQAPTVAGAVNRSLRTAKHVVAEAVRKMRQPETESVRAAVA